jgi:hypothetical protein
VSVRAPGGHSRLAVSAIEWVSGTLFGVLLAFAVSFMATVPASLRASVEVTLPAPRAVAARLLIGPPTGWARSFGATSRV